MAKKDRIEAGEQAQVANPRDALEISLRNDGAGELTTQVILHLFDHATRFFDDVTAIRVALEQLAARHGDKEPAAPLDPPRSFPGGGEGAHG